MHYFSSPKAIFIFICCFAIISTFVRIRWFISAIAVHLMHQGITASAVYSAVEEGYAVWSQYLQRLILYQMVDEFPLYFFLFFSFQQYGPLIILIINFCPNSRNPKSLFTRATFLISLVLLISLSVQYNSPRHPPQNTSDLFFSPKKMWKRKGFGYFLKDVKSRENESV